MKSVIFPLLTIIFLSSCGSNQGRFKKNPLDEIIKELPTNEPFTIILQDMDAQGNFVQTYYHKYRIIKGNNPNDLKELTTDWHEVSEREFNSHINDMGMEIASRDSSGKLSKSVAPPGYSNYVGNEKYGSWRTNSGGQSFWAFYGQYAFMSSMFNMMTYPVYRSFYSDWRGNYYGTNRTYYGPSSGGRNYYGTNSRYNSSVNPNSSWSRNSSNFKNRVSSRTSRSSGYSGGLRSRSGGYGK